MNQVPAPDLVILAGGKGTRLGLSDIPKPMVQIEGRPLLEHQIEIAKRSGIKRIFIVSNHLASVITSHFGDGQRFGVEIVHLVEEHPLGTAGALLMLQKRLTRRFILLYGDIYLDMDLAELFRFDAEAEAIATLTVHPNDHPHDSDLVEVQEDRVISFHSKNRAEDPARYFQNLVNAAVYVLAPKIFDFIPTDRASDLALDIFPKLLKNGQELRAYRSAEYIKDMGTKERLSEVCKDVRNGKPARMARVNKRPAVFIDRDGVLVKYVEWLYKPELLELFPGAAASLRELNRAGILALLVTNQPVVATNKCSLSDLQIIHNKLESLLGAERAFLDKIYFCPHHPDKGYAGENPELKINCDCRKPKTGMIERGVREYNVDLSKSWIIGDTTVDLQTGKNAGLRSILVRTGLGGNDRKYAVKPDLTLDSFPAAVEHILSLGFA